MDMYHDIDDRLKPLAHACCETLSRYRHLSVSSTIMDGSFLDTGEFEVMLSPGLGKYFPQDEKQNLFQDAKTIADLLDEVMLRRTKEEREGKKQAPSYEDFSMHPGKVKQGLEQLGHAQQLQKELQWLLEGEQVRPGLRRLTPQDLPPLVKASRGYDHRGRCYDFAHETLGELGRIVLIQLAKRRTILQAELFTRGIDPDSTLLSQRKKVFGAIVKTVSDCFEENFPA